VSDQASPQTISGTFQDHRTGSTSFCLDLHFEAEGRFFCETDVCLAEPPCPR